ncbi:AraC family transcriptional regulator [Cytophagales bacterium WSM2-2]|nr:AraC family transcriptional regulator [Cytophagales bacterium WSM2-2]
MKYTEFAPCERLTTYIKCFYFFESDDSTDISDIVFPGGNMEIIFNLGEGIWKTASRGIYHQTPKIELWGQITRPLPVRSEGKNRMLGIRFYSHGASSFLKEELWEFNDQVSDASDLLGKSVRQLREKLLEVSNLPQRIELIECYLLERLFSIEKNSNRISMIGQIARELQTETLTGDIKTLASKYDMTPRYLQKLFLQYTGVTPKLYHKINRFQSSLRLVTKKESSLTNIAYDCGYFDQSHFIREFKSFTGITPSDYSAESFPVALALSNS